jgi:osmotically-inducible protein OsmY
MRGDQDRYEDDRRNEERDRDRRSERAMTRRPDDQQMSSEGSAGEWYGYIQPYRYYGPGYRGVGYYSVLYQGPDPSRAGEDEMGESQTQFDPRNVRYGQGQGTGAAWVDRPRSSGSFAGRGPKGYQRSDDRIREDVSDRLAEHPDLDASDMEVKVSKGEVTLTGSVDSRWAKRLAEDLVEACPGVRDVMNHLRVPSESHGTPPASGSTADTTASSRQTRNGRRPVSSNR